MEGDDGNGEAQTTGGPDAGEGIDPGAQADEAAPSNSVPSPCKKLLVSACFDKESCTPRGNSERSGEYELYDGACGGRAKQGTPIYCKPDAGACGSADANYLYVSSAADSDGEQLTWHLQDEGSCGEGDSPVSVVHSGRTGIDSAENTIECTCADEGGDADVTRKDLLFATSCLESAGHTRSSFGFSCLALLASAVFVL